MRHTFFLFALSIGLAANAQSDPKEFAPYSASTAKATLDTPQVATSTAGMVTIHESERVAALMKDYASHKQPLKGFRVQIFLGDRNRAEETRRTFLVHHPDVPAYLSYLAPNFRVRVGDLRDKLPAEKLRADLKDEFPGLYVVPDDIELPRIE